MLTYPLADNVLNRFALSEKKGTTWQLISQYSPNIEDVYLIDGTTNPLQWFNIHPFNSDPISYYNAILPYLGKSINYTFDPVLIGANELHQYRIQWISTFEYSSDNYLSSFYHFTPTDQHFQFGQINLIDVGIDAVSLQKTWASYNPYSIFMANNGEFTAKENLFLKASVIRNAFVSSTHSSDYQIQYYQNNYGDFPYIRSDNPSTSSYVEITLNFPVSSYYDICLRDSNAMDIYDGNQYSVSIDGEIYRTYNQKPIVEDSTNPYTINFGSTQISYPSIPIEAYENFEQLPMEVYDTERPYGNDRVLSNGEILRIASGYFRAGDHVVRIQFSKQQAESFSQLRYDQILLYYQSIKGFSIPVTTFENSLSTSSNLHNITIFLNSTLMQLLYGETYPNIGDVRKTTQFQLYAKPYIGFNTGNLPDIIRGRVSARRDVTKQLSYITSATSVIKIDVFAYDTDIQASEIEYQINGKLWQSLVTNDNVVIEDAFQVDDVLYVKRCNFAKNLFSIEGLNSITFRITDAKGHTTYTTMSLYKDSIVPTISLIEQTIPNEGSFGDIDPNYIIRVTDNGEIGKVWYEIGKLSGTKFEPFLSTQNVISATTIDIKYQAQKHVIFDYDLNLTRYNDLIFNITIPKNYFQQGINAIRFYAKDRTPQNINSVTNTLTRDGVHVLIQANNFEWRYVNINPLLNITAVEYEVGSGSTPFMSSNREWATPKWIDIGVNDIGSYEYIEQEFNATRNSITTVLIKLTTTQEIANFPVLIEIVDKNDVSLTSALAYAGSDLSRELRQVDIPDIVVSIGETYRIRITPIEAPYNLYYALAYEITTPSDAIYGKCYGYIRGIRYDTGCFIAYSLAAADVIIPTGPAGAISYKVNNGFLRSGFENGVCEDYITNSLHGVNKINIYVDLSSGIRKSLNLAYLWISPYVHLPPSINITSPILHGRYKDNITVEFEYSYPEFNETYTINLYLYDARSLQEYWLGNLTLTENNNSYNIARFEFNSTEIINGLPWLDDGSQYQIKIKVKDQANVYGTIYANNVQFESDFFSINNYGSGITLLSPTANSYFSRNIPISFRITTIGVDLFSVQYYFDTNIAIATDIVKNYYQKSVYGTEIEYLFYISPSLNALSEGYHVITIIAEDMDGSKTYATLQFYRDISNYIDIIKYSPSVISPNRDIEIEFTYQEDYAKVEIYMLYKEQYSGSQGFKLIHELTDNAINGTIDIGKLNVGSYFLTFIVTDLAGNTARDTVEFTVEETGGLFSVLEQFQSILTLLFGGLGGVGIIDWFYKQKRDPDSPEIPLEWNNI